VSAADAGAGRLHRDLETRLREAPPGESFAVIVEMKEQLPAAALMADMPKAPRNARAKALVRALRERAQRGQGALKAELAQQHALGAVKHLRAFWIFNGFALTAREPLLRRLAARDDVLEVRLDREILPPPRPASAEPGLADTEWNIAMVRAPEVWTSDPPYDGSGVVVGSFDTGVDGAHQDLSARYRGDDAISWFDPYGQHASPFDFHGHGTHTTATAVGGNAGGSSIGVAPGARWIAAKAWADNGIGQTSAFHQIFEWFLAPGGDPENAPDVVINSWALSLGGCITEFAPDIQAWRAAGIFPAFAAGNSGPGASSVRSPGAYPESFAVGATDMFDEVASFSGRGPSPCGGIVKPDISAPGASVRSAMPGGSYGTLSGTSMATPHVAGAVAVLRSINPALTIDEVGDILKLGATDISAPGADSTSGAGRLDLFVSAQIAMRSADTPLVKVVATQPIATEANLASGTLTFTRTGNTDAPLEVKFDVAGTATPGSDHVALPGTITIPAGAASVALPVVPLDDTLLEPNETVSITLRADEAYIALGTRVATVIIVSDELFPDLVTAALTAPAVAGAGQSITVSETTKNQGGGAAAGSTTRYFLSSNSVLDAADVALASRPVPALAPGASSSGSAVVAIPQSTAAGTWYLLATADAAGEVPEDVETNNTSSRSIQIGSDLTVAALSAPAVAGAGPSIVISDTTANLGGGPAEASQTRYFLSANSSLDATDVPLGGRGIAALGPGASNAGNATAVIPDATPTGNWYIIATADAPDAVRETSETNNTRAVSIRIGPDLSVAAFTAPAAAGAGQSVPLTDTTRNQGGGAAPGSTTQFYLSINPTFEATDLLLGGREVPALGPGTSETGPAAVMLPADLASGTWYLFAKTDGPDALEETSEGNNVAVRTIRVGPDLSVSTLSAPATAGAGDSITVGDSTGNTGGGSAGASSTQYFLSANSVLDAADMPLDSRVVPALAAGTSHPGSLVVVIPEGTAPGTWYVIAKSDAEERVSETVETNNIASRTIRIGSDLIVSTVSAPSMAGAGQTLTITDTTKNQGGGMTSASTTRYYLSADATLDAGDVLVGSRSVPALAAGASDSGSVQATVPPDTATGSWQIIVSADATGAVAETTENNNEYRRSITIGADLVVSALTVPSDTGAGLAVSIAETSKNQGGGTAAPSRTDYFLSSNSTLDEDDVLLGSRAVAALATGASSAGSTLVTIPPGTPAGAWYILAKADGAGTLPETSESNNVTSRTLRIGPDLIVSGLAAPSVAGAGQNVTFTDTVKNQGGAPAAVSRTQYFLSSDASFQPSDVPLGSREVPALAPGASNSGPVQLTLPAGTATAKWYVLAIADSAGTVDESMETNNMTSRLVNIGPDLTVSAFTSPTAAVAGQHISVTDTTKNQGGDGAPASVTQFFLSTNGMLDSADTLLGERAIGALAAGASSTASLELTIPATTPPGRWYIIVAADGVNALIEPLETNNTIARTIDVSAP
jgi:subtilisin family serine protease/uncharacterized membrane protein